MLAVSLFRRFTIKSLTLILLLSVLTEMVSGSSVYTHARRLIPSQYPAWIVNAVWTDSGLIVANRTGTGEIARSIIKLPPTETPAALELCVAEPLSKNDTDQLLEHGIPFADTLSSPGGNPYWLLKINPDPHKAVNLNLDLEVVSHCTSVVIQGQHYSHRDSVKTSGDIPPILSTGEDFQVSLKVIEEEQADTFSGVPGDQRSGGLSGSYNHWGNDPFKLDKPRYPGDFSNPKQQPFDLMVAYLQRVFSSELIKHWLQQWFQYAIQQLNTPEDALREQENHLEDLFLLVFSTETGNYQIYNQRLSDGQHSQNRLGFHISEQGIVSPYIEIHQTVETLYLPLRLVRIDPVTGDYVEVTGREVSSDGQQDTDDIAPVSYIKTLIEQQSLFWRCDFTGLTFSANLKQLAQRLQASMNGHFSFLPEETASSINHHLSYLFISLAVPDTPSRASPSGSVRRQLGRVLHKQLGSDKTRLLIGHQGVEYLQTIGNRINNRTKLKPESLTALMTVLFSDQVACITKTGLFRQVPTGQSSDGGKKKVEKQGVTATPVVTDQSPLKKIATTSRHGGCGGSGEDPHQSGICEQCHQKPVSDGRKRCRDCASKTVPDSFTTEASEPEKIQKAEASGQMTVHANPFGDVPEEQASKLQQHIKSSSGTASLFIPGFAKRATHYENIETALRGMLGLTRVRGIHSGKEREVWKYRNNNHQQFAVKVFTKNRNSSLNRGELNALQIVHPNIARTHAIVLEKNGVYRVTEHMVDYSRGIQDFPPLAVISSLAPGVRLNDKSFFEFLNAHCDPAIILTELILTLSKTLKYLHEEHALMHRDIKPDNIIYNLINGTVKVIDFGTSTTTSVRHFNSAIGTKKYYSPEMHYSHILGHNHTVDIWGIGTVLMNLLTRMTPDNYNKCFTDTPYLEPTEKHLFNSPDNRVVSFSTKPEKHRANILKQHLHSPFNQDNVPAELLDLTASLLSLPGKRPQLDTIIEQLSYIRELLVRKRSTGLFHDSCKSQTH